VLFGLKLI